MLRFKSCFNFFKCYSNVSRKPSLLASDILVQGKFSDYTLNINKVSKFAENASVEFQLLNHATYRLMIGNQFVFASIMCGKVLLVILFLNLLHFKFLNNSLFERPTLSEHMVRKGRGGSHPV